MELGDHKFGFGELFGRYLHRLWKLGKVLEQVSGPLTNDVV